MKDDWPSDRAIHNGVRVISEDIMPAPPSPSGDRHQTGDVLVALSMRFDFSRDMSSTASSDIHWKSMVRGLL